MDDSRERNRRSIRLKEYDDGQPGAYFIRVCAHQQECLFREIIEGEMHSSKVEKKVQSF